MRCAIRLFALVVIITTSHWIRTVHAQEPPAPTGPENRSLTKIRDAIEAGDYGNIHSVIAIHRGQLVVEWYFTGPDERLGSQLGVVKFDAATLHDLRSITKSVVSILLGIALDEGVIKSVEDTLEKYFSDNIASYSTAHSRIQLRHLLSMTSGIRWDERTYPYTDPRNSETALFLADDRLEMILSEPIVSSPGERFNYSGGDVELIAKIIERVTNVPLVTYATEKLFGPLGIEELDWLEYPDGGPVVASGLRMRPLDMAKIGQLVLQNGRWDDSQLVSEAWIQESTSFKVHVRGDGRCGRQYGYFWWLSALCSNDKNVQFTLGDGNGGQRLYIIPELDTILVTTAGFYNRNDRASHDVAMAILSALFDENLDR